MAVAGSDLLSPVGRLIPAVHFPGQSTGTVSAKLDEFVADGARRASAVSDATAKDDAVRLWGYYRAFDEVYQRLMVQPASAADSDEGSRSYLQGQIDAAKAERDAMLEEFEDLLEEEDVTEPDSYGTIPSYR